MLPYDPAISMRRLRLRLATAAIGFAAVLLSPGTARAGHDSPVGAGVGFYLALVVGDTVGLGWGGELFANGYFGNEGICSEGENPVVGAVVQVGAINVEAMQLVLAANAGSDTEDQYGFVGEIGAAAHLRSGHADFGLHTGVLFQSPAYLVGFARQEWFLDSYSFGGGARANPTFGPYECNVDY